MGADSLCRHEQLHDWLAGLDFRLQSSDKTGCLFFRETDATCLVIDTHICSQKDYPYVAYTSRQNELAAEHQRVFRFLFDADSSLALLQREIELFLGEESDPEKINHLLT